QLGIAAKDMRPGADPLRSGVSMDALYPVVRESYETLRSQLSHRPLEHFDELFQHWLYWTYDPLDALADYFLDRPVPGRARIHHGTGGRADEEAVVAGIAKEFQERAYGPEAAAWLSWLLRFALPAASDPQVRNRFRGVPSALGPTQTDAGQWTHVVIDEAQ